MKAVRVTMLIAGILVAWLAFNTASWAQSLENIEDRQELYEQKVRFDSEKSKPSFKIKPVKQEIKKEVRDKMKNEKVKVKAIHKQDIKVHVKHRPQLRPVRVYHGSR